MWRRFAVNASVLTVSAALEEARDELADPVSDRVIETFVAAHERGQSVVVDVLRTLADDVTKDLQLNEQIITGQTEVRAQAVVAALLPFFVLLLLVSSNDGFRDFYRSTAGFVVICIGAGMAFARLEADQRDRAAARGSPRAGGRADEGRVDERPGPRHRRAGRRRRRGSSYGAWCAVRPVSPCASPRTRTGPAANSAPRPRRARRRRARRGDRW